MDVLRRGKLFDKAVEAVKRYRRIDISPRAKEAKVFTEPTKAPDDLYEEWAKYNLQRNDHLAMKTSLEMVSSHEARVRFLRTHKLIKEEAEELSGNGKKLEAARLLRDHGSFLEAAGHAKQGGDSNLAGECLLAYVRTGKFQSKEDKIKYLHEAEALFKSGNRMWYAEVLLELGRVTKDVKKVRSAGKIFNETRNTCGELEVTEELFHLAGEAGVPVSQWDNWILVRVIERVLNAIFALLKKKKSVQESRCIEMCETYFGLHKKISSNKRSVKRKEGVRFLRMSEGLEKETHSQQEWLFKEIDIRNRIADDLFGRVVEVIKQVRLVLDRAVLVNTEEYHSKATRNTCNNLSRSMVDLIRLDASAQTFYRIWKSFHDREDVFCGDSFTSCENLLKFLQKLQSVCQSSYGSSLECVHQLVGISKAKAQLTDFARALLSPQRVAEPTADLLLQLSTIQQLVKLPSDILSWMEDTKRELNRQECKTVSGDSKISPDKEGFQLRTEEHGAPLADEDNVDQVQNQMAREGREVSKQEMNAGSMQEEIPLEEEAIAHQVNIDAPHLMAKHFDHFKTDDSGCSICHVYFEGQEDFQGWEDEETINDGEAGVLRISGSPAMESESKIHTSGKLLHTYKTHIAANRPHWTVLKKFDLYREYYEGTLQPLLEIEEQFHQDTTCAGLEEAMAHLQRARSKVDREILEIERTRKWESLQPFKAAANEYRSALTACGARGIEGASTTPEIKKRGKVAMEIVSGTNGLFRLFIIIPYKL